MQRLLLFTLVTFVLLLPAGCRHANPPLTAALVPPLATNPATPPVEHAGVAVYVDDELIRDYAPVPALKTHVTTMTGPKFPVIDVHCHWSLAQDPGRLLAAMKKLGETKAVNLSGGWGDGLDKMLAKFHAPHPDQLLVFCNIDFSRIDEPAFQTDVASDLESAHAKGASGLKIFKDLGLTIHDKSGKIVPIDDPRLDVIWQTCGRLRMPVLIHSGDPSAFFQPIDRTNERWMQLRRHPDWSFYGKDYPTYDEVLAQHLRVIARHPDTVFVSAHLANSSEDLTKLSGWLRQYPNWYVDLSGRVPELGRQPYTGRKFLIEFQDRVCFGTDRYPGRLDQPRELIYYRYLETSDEYFNYFDNPFPTEGEWRIYGAYLPDDVLKKIYSVNADRALKGLPPDRPSDPATRATR